MTHEKLNIQYFVEAGCLGADGKKHIDSFCDFSQQQLNSQYKDHFTFEVRALTNIHQHHFQYIWHSKKLNEKQVTQYFLALDIQVKTFEDEIDNTIVSLIEDYLNR